MWRAVAAGVDDVPSWLEVVREVEPLFGPMPEFATTLTTNIARGTAICVHGADGVVLGGALLGAARAHINWLAVRASARRDGVGRALMIDVLHRYEGVHEIAVDTFGDDNVAGRPARRLYESFGFVAAHELPRGPEGGSRERFVLRR